MRCRRTARGPRGPGASWRLRLARNLSVRRKARARCAVPASLLRAALWRLSSFFLDILRPLPLLMSARSRGDIRIVCEDAWPLRRCPRSV